MTNFLLLNAGLVCNHERVREYVLFLVVLTYKRNVRVLFDYASASLLN